MHAHPYPPVQSTTLDFSHILGHPFSLATVSIAMMAWLITFVSQVISDVDASIPAFPRFAWWTATYELFCLLGVSLTLALDRTAQYQLALVGFLSAGLVFTCSAANTFVYHDKAAMEAAGAGHILLSIIQILWILHFGTRGGGGGGREGGMVGTGGAGGMSARPLSPVYAASQSMASHSHPQMYTSAQLAGFETASPGEGYGGQGGQHQYAGGGYGAGVEEVMQPTEYPLRAKAVYNYEANPEDANEISFVKDEVLEVSDVSGRWWQARRANGETGIAPSNYLVLI